VVAGCASTIHGTPTANQADAAAYRTEMSSSSAAATSSRRAAAQASAIAAACESFRDPASIPITAQAVTRYNEFVDAHDSNAPDQDAKRDTAAQTLENAAQAVETSVSSGGDALPADMAQKFTEYVSAARALAAEARKMSYTAPVEALNGASKRVNDALGAARSVCPIR
jgi:hypothetical protein